MGLVRLVSALGLLAVAALACSGRATGATTAPGPPGGKTPLQCVREATASITASPSEVPLGQSSTLSWSLAFPEGCTDVEGTIVVGGLPAGGSGTRVVTPMSTGTFRFLFNVEGRDEELGKATVTVKLPKVVDIKGGGGGWIGLLVQAVGTEGTTVRLAPGVDMDLSNREAIPIAKGVALTGDPNVSARGQPGGRVIPVGPLATADPGGSTRSKAPPTRRNARELGPRIFTRTKPRPLFNIVGDDVTIAGFRLHGPHFGIEDGDENLERGIQACTVVGAEITDMEIAGWSGQAIYVCDDDLAPRQFNPDAVKIRHNYIHNNQHVGGNGYGVDVSAGGYALIEYNVFDLNRHAIAASGKPGVGYRAFRNLVLRGGGVHGKFYNPNTHQFDVHGDGNCPPVSEHILNCGNAGDQFWFEENAFQYRRDNDIKLRGVPRVAAYIDRNVFPRSLGDSLVLREKVRVTVGTGAKANIANVDTYGQYGVCDIDGDGRDDLFLPTGMTWWYSSAGKNRWSYLRAATERLHQVGLGDFDGDRRCDVVAAATGNRLEYSSGGTADWASLPGTFRMPFDQLRFGDFNGDRVTDVFHRARGGQWRVVSPGRHGWRDLQSSGFAVGELRFGDFNGDRVTDVLGPASPGWSVSYGGATTWRPLNKKRAKEFQQAVIGDVDGNGRDDVVRYLLLRGRLEWVSAGRGDWKTLASVRLPLPPGLPRLPEPLLLTGNLDGRRGDEALLVDDLRVGRAINTAGGANAAHNLFPY